MIGFLDDDLLGLLRPVGSELEGQARWLSFLTSSGKVFADIYLREAEHASRLALSCEWGIYVMSSLFMSMVH